MSDYFLAKLAQVNYHIAIHPGDANVRLTSQWDKILVLSALEVPDKYRTEFCTLIDLLNRSSIDAQQLNEGLQPVRINVIRNNTATKYIKMLIDIQTDTEITAEQK